MNESFINNYVFIFIAGVNPMPFGFHLTLIALKRVT